jgi:Bap31/Bap29 transmembrane region
MRSILWTAIFVILCLEVALTFVLVLPVPRRLRNGVCRAATDLDLKGKLYPVLRGLGIGLVLALLDSFSFLQFLVQDNREIHGQHHRHHDHHAREREYQTERNIYLAGFCLTLIFVIGRITDLMQEHVELEDELERARKVSPTEAVQPQGEGIEMKPLISKKEE